MAAPALRGGRPLQGLLADLAERRDPIGVSLSSGDHRNGRVEVVGADLIGLRLEDGGLSLLSLDSIASLHLGTDTDLVGDRPAPDATRTCTVCWTRSSATSRT